MEATTIKASYYLSPCLFLVQGTKAEAEEKNMVVFTLKIKAGTGSKDATYKKKVERFHSGTVADWIEVLDSLDEIWSQNSLIGAADREASIKTILRDEALTSFEASIEEDRAPANDDNERKMKALTVKMIESALEAVSREIFPHRALENQKLWMRRSIRKPKDMSFRKMQAALTRMNTKLIRFPGATEGDVFSPAELLEILEWSLPNKWRAIFDLASYIPSQNDRARLIVECEAIERSEKVLMPASANASKLAKAKAKQSNGTDGNKRTHQPKNSDKNSFYCTEHGQNPTHKTSDCYTIKNRKKRTDEQNSTKGKDVKSFSNNKFRKEINVMSKGKNKKKVLELYAAVIKREQAKVKAKKAKAKKAAELSESSDEDEDMSVNIIEPVVATPPLKNSRASLKLALTKAIARKAHSNRKETNRVRFLHPKGKKPVKEPLVKHKLTQEVLNKSGEKDEEDAFQERISHLGQVKTPKASQDEAKK